MQVMTEISCMDRKTVFNQVALYNKNQIVQINVVCYVGWKTWPLQNHIKINKSCHLPHYRAKRWTEKQWADQLGLADFLWNQNLYKELSNGQENRMPWSKLMCWSVEEKPLQIQGKWGVVLKTTLLSRGQGRPRSGQSRPKYVWSKYVTCSCVQNMFMRCDVIVELFISTSLIIHEENTKEINTETEFGYVMKHLHKIKPTFISIFSFNTDLFEMLYQTLGRVFHQDIQTPRSC